jgi:REP element-mobilizing transposase RayT
MRGDHNRTPLRDLRTYGASRAVRHPDCDYSGNVDVHLTVCATRTNAFVAVENARLVCENVEFYCTKLEFQLYGYCLMPDHLHVLLSPAESRVPVGTWLRQFKSFTTRQHQLRTGEADFWQRSAHDHVCRTEKTAENVLTYIVNNPVRAGLVDCWQDWPWTKVFITI